MSTSQILALAAAAMATAALTAVLPAQEQEPPKPEPETKVEATDAKAPKQSEKIATLGVETRAPSKEECVRYALKLNVRYQGQMIRRLAKDSVAAKAGIRRGDIILMIDKVEIFSSDDIHDVLMVRKPHQTVTLQLIRGKDKKKQTLRLKLGEQKIPARKGPRLKWHYAGLPYLKDALAQAKKESKRVLVGLSGAET
jgi:C-terminal processing protease CtpA/Prc